MALNPDNVKLQPNDPESEEALLGAFIDQPRKLFDAREYLDEGDVFYSLKNKEYYLAILAVFNSGQEIRPIYIIQELRRTGKADLLEHFHPDELRNKGIGLNAMRTAIHLRELYIKRLALNQAFELVRSVYDAEPLDDQVALAQKLAETISGKMVINREKPTSYYVARTLNMIQEAASTKTGLIGVNTGSGKLNALTGGWRPAKFIILAARPAQGKTAVALHHLKMAAIDGTPVAFMSAEMPNEELILRLISSECGITYEELAKGRHEDGKAFTEQEWAAIHKAGGVIEKLPIHFYDGGNFDIGNIIYWVLELIRRYGIGLFIADYIQIIDDRTVRGGDMRQIVASVSRKLKLLTTTANIPVIALSQLGRQVDTRPNRRPLLSDLKESGQLEQDADIVAGLYRDDHYKLEDAKAKAAGGKMTMPVLDYVLEYDFLKFRGGKLRMVRLGIDIGTNRIADETTFFSPQQLSLLEPTRTDVADKQFDKPLDPNQVHF